MFFHKLICNEKTLYQVWKCFEGVFFVPLDRMGVKKIVSGKCNYSKLNMLLFLWE